ncbi:hypothetical protein JHK82_016311 [Glycine max]|nr:hypothetical protein JHK82_016311 [Glycine max]
MLATIAASTVSRAEGENQGASLLAHVDAYSIGDHEEDHDSMPQLPRILLLLHSHRAKHGVFFILDEASLVAAYVGKVSSFLGHSHPSVSCFYERNEVFLSLIIAWPISEIPDFESR